MSLARSFTRSLLLSVVLPALILIIASGPGFAQVPLRQEDPILKQMFDAILTKSYDKFIANGDQRFKTSFTPKMFESLADKIGPRLQQGYSETFLTTLHQHDYVVYVWKLTFKDAQDDLLVSLALKGGNVVGFLVR
jgi:hypothetical protein